MDFPFQMQPKLRVFLHVILTTLPEEQCVPMGCAQIPALGSWEAPLPSTCWLLHKSQHVAAQFPGLK